MLITYVDWGGSKDCCSRGEAPEEGALSGKVELAFNTAFTIRHGSKGTEE